MRIILFLSSSLAFAAGFLIFSNAKSAIHEIEAFVLFLISAVFFVGSCLIEAISVARKSIELRLDAIKQAASSKPTDTYFSRPQVIQASSHRTPEREPDSDSDELEVVEDPTPVPSVESLVQSPTSNSAAEKVAWKALGYVRSLQDAGRHKEASVALKELIQRYPQTEAADKARRAISRKGEKE